MKTEILSHFTTECPWRDTLYWYDTIDSTNTRAKQLAKEGAPNGTILVAGYQTGGRGRMGRDFSSPEGMGVYLSVVLRPNCTADQLMHLTCAAAVASCQAIKEVCGIFPDIKWTNDLVWQKRKLGGILTELSINSTTGLVDYAIVGIGINCNEKTEDFPPQLQTIATSIRNITGKLCSPALLSAILVEKLYAMDALLFSNKDSIMDIYRSHCITLSKEIAIISNNTVRYGTALDLDSDGGLVIRFTEGIIQTVTSGEVSVRGMYGYL